MAVQLSSVLVESFAGVFLSPMYDDVQPTPQCHRNWWDLYCSDASYAGIAAPRGHAKSTALTHDFVLATACFGVEPHILVVSATEELALAHLGDIATELRDNDELRREFRIDRFLTDSKSEIIVKCKPTKENPHGYEFRILARGAGQKLRGLKWRGRRPGLIICDDMEEDEQVENVDRRKKFRRWVMRALIPLGRRQCKIRWHGTILHEDSMLARIMKDSTWTTLFNRAHKSFDDFSEILWPEMWSEARLRKLRQSFIEQQDAAGYSQEMLNNPLDNGDTFLKKANFLSMEDQDRKAPKRLAVGCDFAVSKADTANKTSFTIGGECAQNLLHILEDRTSRWDTLEWLDEMFKIHEDYRPDFFFVEDGVIWKSVSPMLYREMQKRRVWFNCVPILPVKDKAVRGRPFQRRHRSNSMRFEKDRDGYVVYEEELMRFTGTSDALADDRFDSTAILVKGFDTLSELIDEDFMDEDELELLHGQPPGASGRSLVTGY